MAHDLFGKYATDVYTDEAVKVSLLIKYMFIELRNVLLHIYEFWIVGIRIID